MIWLPRRSPRMPIGFWGAAAASISGGLGPNFANQPLSYSSTGSFISLAYVFGYNGVALKRTSDTFGGAVTDTPIGTEWYDPETAGIGAGYRVRYTARSSISISLASSVTIPQGNFVVIPSGTPQLRIGMVRTAVGLQTEWMDIEIRDEATLITVVSATIFLSINKTA